jgi:hypothetical protein
MLIILPQHYENKPDNNLAKEIVFVITETRFDGHQNFDGNGKS